MLKWIYTEQIKLCCLEALRVSLLPIEFWLSRLTFQYHFIQQKPSCHVTGLWKVKVAVRIFL